MRRKSITLPVSEVRKYVRMVLAENDSGMAGGGADIGMGGGGMMMGAGYGFMNYGGSLKNIFIDPFIDVVKTAKGAASEMSVRTKNASKVIIESILSTFIPLYETNYNEMFKHMKKSLDEVKKKYEKVYAANDEALRNKDARFLAFMYDPTSYITAKTLGNSPAAAKNILEIFTAGDTGVGKHLLEAIRYIKELQMEVTGVSRYHRMVPQRLRRQATKNAGSLPWEGQERPENPILEVEQAPPGQPAPAAQPGQPAAAPAQTVEQRLAAILNDPNVKKELAATPLAQQIRADGQQILSSLVTQLSKDITGVSQISTIDDVVRLSGGRVQEPNVGQLPENEKQQAETAAVGAIKSSLSEFYRKSLQGAISQAQTEGVDDSSAYIRTLQGLLTKVGS